MTDRTPSKPGGNPPEKKNNLRMALTLASIAIVIFIGFILKSALLGR